MDKVLTCPTVPSCRTFQVGNSLTTISRPMSRQATPSKSTSFTVLFARIPLTTRRRYQQLIGCSSVNLDNTTDLYARYTNSVICNAIVQNSIGLCDSSRDPEPLCADSCAEYAISEQEISASSDLCGSAGPNALSQIRADFTNCALPARSLSGGTCISAVDNEPNDCGYGSNLSGLCGFCGTSSPNATDSCCVNANAESRCQNVDLPSFTSLEPLFTTTTIAQPTSSASTAPVASDDGTLSAGQIAGIVVGSVLGALLLMALIIFGCVLLRRRKSNPPSSIFNQPSPARRGSSREKPFGDGARPEMVPGRVARMAALEDGSTSSRPRSDAPSSERGFKSGSPDRHRIVAAGGLPRRNGSLSSQSALNLGEDPNSPQTSSGFGDQFSSPDAVTSGQSEQLAFFKDYYSQDEIHPHDTVATLWAYQPRANDEFELERGDMLKVVGIWDDGWATGVKVTERAEAWERRRQEQRDSGVSNGGGPSPVPATGEIKAFPLVCVCLPQHWRKTIDGDTTGEAPDPHGGNVPPRTSTPP
ncbi:hypothetical protein EJ05DRAFT_182744 [Pseudovirgaria hyperparasitica]|uniref:SH3 domain-containing protein n=1 Tax=Pseudovirgaria hyperparasitica TaxID=470096 RepID=A0A6A6WHY7_9PEZI|nr:uncharacterized protein EJ05DRAFT_182744 [Pseudovirgaria hyperparasitica]KAF2761715.1 hypothetical protein EJ05DRAFT_182744 [Pseudovirgaria hyperparasitica]